LRLRVSLEALDDVQSGKKVLVKSELTQPIVLQVPARILVELGMLLNEFVATIELQAQEGRGSVEDFCLLLGSRRATGQSPVEVGVPDDKRPREVVPVRSWHLKCFFEVGPGFPTVPVG
jgi:hypothetical protein